MAIYGHMANMAIMTLLAKMAGFTRGLVVPEMVLLAQKYHLRLSKSTVIAPCSGSTLSILNTLQTAKSRPEREAILNVFEKMLEKLSFL